MRKPDYERRVVVTGLGVISSVGNDPKTAWSRLVNGVSGLVPLTRFDTTPYDAKWGGEVHDFVAGDWMDHKAARRSETTMAYGVASAKQAIADSGFEITDENRTEVGVVYGSGAGGQALMIESVNNLRDKGPRSVAPVPTTSAKARRRSVAATASRSSRAPPSRPCSRSGMPVSRTCAAWASPGRASRSRPSRDRST